MSKKKNDNTVFTRSNSFALFGDDIIGDNGGSNISLFNKNIKKDKKAVRIEQAGSQSVNEEPSQPEQHDQKSGFKAKRGFRASKDNKVNINAKGNTNSVKGQDCTKNGGELKISGNKQSDFATEDKGIEHRTRRSKRKVQEIEGGNEVYERSKTSGKTVVDYKAYKLKEFDISNKVQNYSIYGDPRKIKDEFLVEVIINGFRYRVSPWSIKDGQYIQGLDSNFLVKKYKIGKK